MRVKRVRMFDNFYRPCPRRRGDDKTFYVKKQTWGAWVRYRDDKWIYNLGPVVKPRDDNKKINKPRDDKKDKI